MNRNKYINIDTKAEIQEKLFYDLLNTEITIIKIEEVNDFCIVYFRKKTETEIAELANIKNIADLKHQLAEMDYKTSKYADGEYTQSEWEEIVLERRVIREQIRALEL